MKRHGSNVAPHSVFVSFKVFLGESLTAEGFRESHFRVLSKSYLTPAENLFLLKMIKREISKRYYFKKWTCAVVEIVRLLALL